MRVFRKRDLLWLLAYPIYQIVGTIRHEGSHAVAALLQGGDIYGISVLPSSRGWGGVAIAPGFDGGVFMSAAPYLCDAFAFLLFFILLMRWPCRRHWLWINLAVLGPLTSLIDTANNYAGVVIAGGGDFFDIEEGMNPYLLHTLVPVTICLYLYGMFLIVRRHVQHQRTLPPMERAPVSRMRRARHVAGVALILLLLAAVASLAVGFINCRGLIKMFGQDRPLAPAAFEVDPQEGEALMARIHDFQEAVQAGGNVEPLILSEREVNVLLNTVPDLRRLVKDDFTFGIPTPRGKVLLVVMNHRALVALNDSGVAADITIEIFKPFIHTFFNAQAAFDVSIRDGMLRVCIKSVQLQERQGNMRAMPEPSKRFQAQNLVKNTADLRKLIAGVARLEIRGNTMVLVPSSGH